MNERAFEFEHLEALKKRAISEDFARKSGVISLYDNEAREMGFLSCLPKDQRKGGLQGLGLPYYDAGRENLLLWRLRPDTPFQLNGGPAKYLTTKGSELHLYLPHTSDSKRLDNPKTPLVITEGELKALAVAESLESIGRRYAVVGLSGVNCGWHRKKRTIPTADGQLKRSSYGPASLIDDFDSLALYKRRVYIVFDNDVGSRKHALLFKKSRYQGAMGAEHILAELLRSKGADVRIVIIPYTQNKVGADDYIAATSAYEFYKLIANNWVAQRDVNDILYRPDTDAFAFADSCEVREREIKQPAFAIDKLLPIGGTMILAGAPKVGKSSLALNAAKAVCEGSEFLGIFGTRQGRTAYIQTEMPIWALQQRLKLMGDLPNGLLIHTPMNLKLNYYEDHGYKRTQTGNSQVVANLIEALRKQAVSMVIFDPLIHFSSLRLRDEENVSHLFQIFRNIARSVPCAVMIVHHHRKTARSVNRYEGAEDMLGSQMLFGEADAVMSIYAERNKDGFKFKLLTETRHSEAIEDMELIRYGGNESMLWQAREWQDGSGRYIEDQILDILEEGPITAAAMLEKISTSSASLYRVLGRLQRKERVRKQGNLYYLN